MVTRIAVGLVAAVWLAGCGGLSSAEARAQVDAQLGRYESYGFRFAAVDGLLHVRDTGATEVVLRASAAEFQFELARQSAVVQEIQVRIWNLPPELALRSDPGVLSEDGAPSVGEVDPGLHLGRRWTVRFPPGVDTVTVESVRLAAGDFTFLAFGDIQSGIDRFDEVIDAVNAEPDADFILMLGDLTQSSKPEQFDRVEEAYARIRFPIYATPGNHDVYEPGRYQERFGRATYSFTHRGARFTSFDSGSAGMSSEAFRWFDGWADEARDGLHVVFSHIPALETLGLRSAQWNSRRQAHQFISRSASSDVDLLLFGHVHTHDAYALGGVPTFISGGCGALEEAFDGIGRHFLRVRVSPATQAVSVEVVRVD